MAFLNVPLESVGSSSPHTVVSKGLDHWVNLTCDQHELTGNGSFGSACRLEVDRCATRIEGVMARPLVSSVVGPSLISSACTMVY